MYVVISLFVTNLYSDDRSTGEILVDLAAHEQEIDITLSWMIRIQVLVTYLLTIHTHKIRYYLGGTRLKCLLLSPQFLFFFLYIIL